MSAQTSQPQIVATVSPAEALMLVDSQESTDQPTLELRHRIGADAIEGVGYAIIVEHDDEGGDKIGGYVRADNFDVGTHVRGDNYERLGLEAPAVALNKLRAGATSLADQISGRVLPSKQPKPIARSKLYYQIHPEEVPAGYDTDAIQVEAEQQSSDGSQVPVEDAVDHGGMSVTQAEVTQDAGEKMYFGAADLREVVAYDQILNEYLYNLRHNTNPNARDDWDMDISQIANDLLSKLDEAGRGKPIRTVVAAMTAGVFHNSGMKQGMLQEIERIGLLEREEMQVLASIADTINSYENEPEMTAQERSWAVKQLIDRNVVGRDEFQITILSFGLGATLEDPMTALTYTQDLERRIKSYM